MEDIPNSISFKNYLKKNLKEVKNLYINDNINMFCRKIYNGLYKTTTKRDELEKKIKGFIQSNNSALFLAGPTKIGIFRILFINCFF